MKHISLELLLVINEIKREKHERNRALLIAFYSSLVFYCMLVSFEVTELVNEWLAQHGSKFCRKHKNGKADKQQRFFFQLYVCTSVIRVVNETKYMINVQHNNRGDDKMDNFFHDE